MFILVVLACLGSRPQPHQNWCWTVWFGSEINKQKRPKELFVVLSGHSHTTGGVWLILFCLCVGLDLLIYLSLVLVLD